MPDFNAITSEYGLGYRWKVWCVAELGKQKRRFKFSFQVLSLLMIMGPVPWFGYKFISEAKQFLDSGQVISQEQFGRSVANIFDN